LLLKTNDALSCNDDFENEKLEGDVENTIALVVDSGSPVVQLTYLILTVTVTEAFGRSTDKMKLFSILPLFAIY